VLYAPAHSPECMFITISVHPVPLVAWSEARYVVSEGQGLLDVCVELVGTLSDLAQVTLSTMDYSAVGTSDIIC